MEIQEVSVVTFETYSYLQMYNFLSSQTSLWAYIPIPTTYLY